MVVDENFAKIGLEICEDTKVMKKIRRYYFSDLTAQLVPILEEIKKRKNE